MTPTEIISEVTEAEEGGYNARALGYGIFTQGDDWDGLKATVTVKDAVLCYFDERDSTKADQAPKAVNGAAAMSG